MLVECGFVRATASDGSEWTFTPSLGRIASLGAPHEIVELYAALHDVAPPGARTPALLAPPKGAIRAAASNAEAAAAYVLACLCDQEDPSELIGWFDDGGWHVGRMPASEQIIVAKHLMQHGMVGTATPEKAGSGAYTAEFKAAEYIAAACVHLGLSRDDAERLSMTEFQTMFEMKFPSRAKQRDVPTRDEYRAAMERMKGARGV